VKQTLHGAGDKWAFISHPLHGLAAHRMTIEITAITLPLGFVLWCWRWNGWGDVGTNDYGAADALSLATGVRMPVSDGGSRIVARYARMRDGGPSARMIDGLTQGQGMALVAQ
jgi:hypothetical protein